MPSPSAPYPVTILMATRNGAAHLAEQLASFAAQDHVDWALWVSDDGSEDDTIRILKDFAKTHPERDIRLLEGPRRGAAANFLSLLCHPDLPPGAVALSDQDDIWYPHKLSHALRHLPKGSPAIYSAQSRHIAADGTPLTGSRVHQGAPSFGNALVQNRVAGHCATLTPEALEILRKAGPVDVPFHDWWLYQLLQGAGAQVIVSDEVVLDYRQHAGNVLGGNQGRWGSLLRVAHVFGPTFGRWMRANRAALETVSDLLMPAHHEALNTLAQAPKAGPARVRVFKALGIVRDQPHATALVHFAAGLGRL